MHFCSKSDAHTSVVSKTMASRRIHRATGILCAFLFHIRPAESFTAASVRRQHDVHCYRASVSKTPNDRTEDELSVLLDQILAVAIDASKQAGAIILGNAGGADVTQRKANSRDLLTLIDPLCEQVSRRRCVFTALDVLAMFVMLYFVRILTMIGLRLGWSGQNSDRLFKRPYERLFPITTFWERNKWRRAARRAPRRFPSS
jgi:hypothetical protein